MLEGKVEEEKWSGDYVKSLTCFHLLSCLKISSS